MERPFGVPAAPAVAEAAGDYRKGAARRIVNLAQIGSIPFAASGFRRRLFCCCSRSRWSRTVGAVSGNRPQFVAHDKLTLDEAQRRGVAHADRGLQRFVKLRQAGAGALAQGGQRRGETRGFDDVGGRAVHVLFAEQAGGVGQPAYGPIALAAAPEVLRHHAGEVTPAP